MNQSNHTTKSVNQRKQLVIEMDIISGYGSKCTTGVNRTLF